MGIMDNEGHHPMGLGNIPSAAYLETRDKIAAARERQLAAAVADNRRLRDAVMPFLRYYHDIRFNLHKEPRPSDAAIEERGERMACVTWAEFYALRDAFTGEQKLDGKK
jgi:hypothetical protein